MLGPFKYQMFAVVVLKYWLKYVTVTVFIQDRHTAKVNIEKHCLQDIFLSGTVTQALSSS
jgi:hypothetical protein